jgi:hypothetical protein
MKNLFFFPIFLLIVAGGMRAQDVDLTSLITNPDFETGTSTGWVNTSDGAHYWSGVNTDARAGKNGPNAFWTWGQGYGNYELSQTVINLENGLYRVECLLMGGLKDWKSDNSGVIASALTTQRLFAGNASDGYHSQFFSSIDQYSAANLAIIGASEAYSFANHEVVMFTEVSLKAMSVEARITGGYLTFGVRTEGLGNTKNLIFQDVLDACGYFFADHFRLTKIDETNMSFENPAASDETIVYSRDNTVYVQSTPANPIKQVQAYDLQGRLIHAGAQVDALDYNFTINDTSGVYIVKVTGKNGIKYRKIAK